MEDVVCNSGLLRITTSEEKEPVNDERKVKGLNKIKEVCGLIGMHISNVLQFHILKIKTSIDAWTTLETLFAKSNISWVTQLNTELMNLNSLDFDTIEVVLARFKELNIASRLW